MNTNQLHDAWFSQAFPDTEDRQSRFRLTSVRDLMREAFAAGRAQGLGEAYDIVLRAPFKQPDLDAEEWDSPEAAHEASLKSMAFDITAEIRAAIEQLRGK